jgi:excisionase family DNA binding protein
VFAVIRTGHSESLVVIQLKVQKEALSIPEVCDATSLGRTTVYKAIAEGRLKARKDGRRTIILTDDLRKYLTALPPVYDEARAVAAAAAAAAQALVLPAPAPANESTAEIRSVPAEARQAGTKTKTKPPEKKPARKRRQAIAEHEQEHETEMTS